MAQSSIVSTNTKLLFSHVVGGDPQPNYLYIDLAQCLSKTNRRSYRQAFNYAVANIKMYQRADGQAYIQTIPTTWVADNATTKAFETWKDQRAEVLREQPSLKAKWSDFKIFMDSTHVQAGTLANLIPVDLASNPFLPGAWDASEYVCPLPGAAQAAAGDAQEVRFHVVGDHVPPGAFSPLTTSVGLIKAYADSRARILHPDPAVPAEFATGFYNVNSSPDEMSQDIMDNVANRNDDPPYDSDDYPGADVNVPSLQLIAPMLFSNFGDASAFSTANSGPFVAPFGLIQIMFEDIGFETTMLIEVDLVPGKYKGILAERGV